MTATLDGLVDAAPVPGGALSARFTLRAATRDAHDRVDAMLSPLELETREGYATFLQAQAAAFITVEAALDVAGAEHVLADWPRRRRASRLLEDLEAMNLEVPQFVAIPIFRGEPAILGAVYVLEGSRLGGALLKRRVPAGEPTAFLSAADPELWRSLTACLDARLILFCDLQSAVDAARSVFAIFEQAVCDRLGVASA